MQALSRRRQSIFRFWWHDGINLAVNESGGFEIPEHLNQHLFRDVRDTALQLVESVRPTRQAIQNNGSPFVSDHVQNAARWIALVEYVRWFAFGTHKASLCNDRHFLAGFRPAVAQGDA